MGKRRPKHRQPHGERQAELAIPNQGNSTNLTLPKADLRTKPTQQQSNRRNSASRVFAVLGNTSSVAGLLSFAFAIWQAAHSSLALNVASDVRSSADLTDIVSVVNTSTFFDMTDVEVTLCPLKAEVHGNLFEGGADRIATFSAVEPGLSREFSLSKFVSLAPGASADSAEFILRVTHKKFFIPHAQVFRLRGEINVDKRMRMFLSTRPGDQEIKCRVPTKTEFLTQTGNSSPSQEGVRRQMQIEAQHQADIAAMNRLPKGRQTTFVGFLIAGKEGLNMHPQKVTVDSDAVPEHLAFAKKIWEQFREAGWDSGSPPTGKLPRSQTQVGIRITARREEYGLNGGKYAFIRGQQAITGAFQTIGITVPIGWTVAPQGLEWLVDVRRAR